MTLGKESGRVPDFITEIVPGGKTIMEIVPGGDIQEYITTRRGFSEVEGARRLFIYIRDDKEYQKI